MELRDASRCWEKEQVFWHSCLQSWWWKLIWHHPGGVGPFLAQCGLLTLGMGVKWGGLSFCTPSWHREHPPRTSQLLGCKTQRGMFPNIMVYSLCKDEEWAVSS